MSPGATAEIFHHQDSPLSRRRVIELGLGATGLAALGVAIRHRLMGKEQVKSKPRLLDWYILNNKAKNELIKPGMKVRPFRSTLLLQNPEGGDERVNNIQEIPPLYEIEIAEINTDLNTNVSNGCVRVKGNFLNYKKYGWIKIKDLEILD